MNPAPSQHDYKKSDVMKVSQNRTKMPNVRLSSVNAVKKTSQQSVKIATQQFATRRDLQNTQHDNINTPKYEIMIENAMQTQQWSVEQSAE